MSPEELEIWTIYEHPLDYPEHWVVRRFSISTDGAVPDDKVRLAGSLDEAREFIPPLLYNLGRGPLDEPQIVESWV